jgi:hypothetical protein
VRLVCSKRVVLQAALPPLIEKVVGKVGDSLLAPVARAKSLLQIAAISAGYRDARARSPGRA